MNVVKEDNCNITEKLYVSIYTEAFWKPMFMQGYFNS